MRGGERERERESERERQREEKPTVAQRNRPVVTDKKVCTLYVHVDKPRAVNKAEGLRGLTKHTHDVRGHCNVRPDEDFVE